MERNSVGEPLKSAIRAILNLPKHSGVIFPNLLKAVKAPAEGLRGEANAGVSTFGTVIRETPAVKVLKCGIY